MADVLLYVGLDPLERDRNEALADALCAGQPDGHFGFKVDLDHALLWGEGYLRRMVSPGRPVFLDLKMNNGPRTMTHVVCWLAELAVADTNIWSHAETNLAETVTATAVLDQRPRLLAATFYTRWTDDYARRHHSMSLQELVAHWARVAVDSGADGVIVPPTSLPAVAHLPTVRLTPGIRLDDATTSSRQRQVATPERAIAAGADILVVSSPIYTAENPAEALGTYLTSISASQRA